MNVYWYCPSQVTQDFNHHLDNPSFRLRCWYTHNYLIKHGINSQIVCDYSLINKPDVVVLMSFGEQEYEIAKAVNSWGATVIHDYSENIRGIPILEETKNLCKYIVCCSTWLRDEEAKTYGDKCIVVKDPYEPSPIIRNHDQKVGEKLKVVWAGMGGNAEWVEYYLKPIVESLGMDYVEISNRPEATLQWDPYWAYHMASCDIAICPQDTNIFPAKSNVKVTTAISLGLPTICSPLQSYKEIITDNVNGFISVTLENWERDLKLLKDNVGLRKQFAQLSYSNIKEEYSIENIAKKWLDVMVRDTK